MEDKDIMIQWKHSSDDYTTNIETPEIQESCKEFGFTILTCMFLYTPPTSLFAFYDLLFVLLFVLDFPKIGNEI